MRSRQGSLLLSSIDNRELIACSIGVTFSVSVTGQWTNIPYSWACAGAEHAKRMLREVRGRAEAVSVLANRGPAGLLSLLDTLLPSLSVPGTDRHDGIPAYT